MVSKAYKNPQGSMPWRVFLFHGVSNGFTESQAFAGTFAGICEIRKPTYQQFRRAGSYWPSCSRDLVNKQYNLKSKNGPLSGAWKESIFAADITLNEVVGVMNVTWRCVIIRRERKNAVLGLGGNDLGWREAAKALGCMHLDLHKALIMSSCDDDNRALKNGDQNYAHNSCT